VPQFQLFLPRVGRAAAVVLALGAVLAVPATAIADDAKSTGGTTAEQTRSTAKAKKPTVRQIQKALGIKADGVMGPKTKRAIKRFQKRNGLKADGIAGPATLEKLGLLGPPANGALDSVPAGDPATILAQIADCESGSNPAAVSPTGKYRGKYQFSQETWESLGGTGKPDEAEEAVQDQLALQLYNERGLAPWPTCGAKVAAATPSAG
jgi:peptidoglycan hydrolase-like protein with peptidoglycan-binding domain